MRWIDSMVVWSQTTLNSGLRFWTTLFLGVRASDASNPLMVGYLLELFRDGALVGPTMLMQ
jgi:hypothetical protein